MNTEDVRKLSKEIDGWLTDSEGELLFRLAKNCRGPGTIVEIGSWKGKSTVWLGCGSKSGNKVKIYAVDPHTGSSEHQKMYGKVWTFEEFKKNILKAEVDDIVVPLVRTSEDAARNFHEPVELIFIDGAHEYEYVKLDFDTWFPLVIDGGMMAFHDSTSAQGPKRVVADLVYKSRRFRNVRLVDSITVAQKVKQNTIKDRIRNRYILFLKNIYDFAGKLHPPKPIVIIGKKIMRMLQG